ncbi:hypothetical protein LR010_00185 [Candidatus Gracilibacteria bacterium]|nr:hypothetical protein [Candidatus Gracilibacteria bacterium]
MDFGPELGIKKNFSADYGVIQQGGTYLTTDTMSEFLISGVHTNEGVVLSGLERKVENGLKLL